MSLPRIGRPARAGQARVRLRLAERRSPRLRGPAAGSQRPESPRAVSPRAVSPRLTLPRRTFARLTLPRLRRPLVLLRFTPPRALVRRGLRRLARPLRPLRRLRRPGPGRPGLRRPGLLRPAAIAAAISWLLAGIALFTCYLHASRTVAVNSDGAANALQAWGMLHGNMLLRGWQLSDVSFYTTELPQYMLIELARGLTPDVVHIAGAMTYTLLVLLAAGLAKGRATGIEATARILLTVGIMLAPQPGSASYVLLLSPDHVGSSVPVLTAWILLDRSRRRWYVPLAAGALLAWALVADGIVALTGAAPLAIVGVSRAYLRTAGRRRPLRASWFELSLAACALLAASGARAALSAIRSAGGFVLWPVANALAAFSQLPQHLMLTIQGLLMLFGADFFSHTLGYVSGLAMLHLVGLGLAAWGLCAALRRFAGQDLAVQLLAVGAVLSLAAYLFGQRPIDIYSTREYAAVLPLAAVLAGRLLAARLRRARLLPALAIVLLGYAASLSRLVAEPPVPPANQQLAGWLISHRLDSGLAGYWIANSVTLDSGGRIALRSVAAAAGKVAAGSWETQLAWYSARAHAANFIVLAPAGPDQPPYPWISDVRAAFGQPARIYYPGSYTVLVWNKNLMADLGPAASPVSSPSSAGAAGRLQPVG